MERGMRILGPLPRPGTSRNPPQTTRGDRDGASVRAPAWVKCRQGTQEASNTLGGVGMAGIRSLLARSTSSAARSMNASGSGENRVKVPV